MCVEEESRLDDNWTLALGTAIVQNNTFINFILFLIFFLDLSTRSPPKISTKSVDVAKINLLSISSIVVDDNHSNDCELQSHNAFIYVPDKVISVAPQTDYDCATHPNSVPFSGTDKVIPVAPHTGNDP